VSDSKKLAILRGIKDRLDIEYLYGHSWEDASECGMVIEVRELTGSRKIRIAVTDLGFYSDEEVERSIARSRQRMADRGR
jgi:hypothetical protein